jgi:hypothetical protein
VSNRSLIGRFPVQSDSYPRDTIAPRWLPGLRADFTRAMRRLGWRGSTITANSQELDGYPVGTSVTATL